MCDIKSKEVDAEMKPVLVEFLEHEKLDIDQALSACKYLNSREKFVIMVIVFKQDCHSLILIQH